MKYAVEMRSDPLIYEYELSSMENGSGIQKLIKWIHRHRQHGDLISIRLLFCIKIRNVCLDESYVHSI
jgi:hypothetical protein